GVFFKHEERALLTVPGKLVVGKALRDEMNRGRLKVNVAFTLPPGAYATLVMKRLFWFDLLEEEAREKGEMHPTATRALEGAFGAAESKPVPPPPPPEPPVGFREAQKRRKAAKAKARASQGPAKAPRPKRKG